jgi:hypothetical protein
MSITHQIVHQAVTVYGLPATHATCWRTVKPRFACWVWGPHFRAIADGMVNAKGKVIGAVFR